ncbi:DNA-binding transcriptional regulator FrlR [Pelotomaculum schinkii]|uniref:DNA-binding transcriptional regulator FrlR n=1 Tax=Pelotomaculum schinkii TaxID=78350 RepID=A0A4Y7R9V0_9FIRM|nr:MULTISPECIES: GntR family transcriptional regulator [Pelotomaculum]TEB05724.1 DNA-binding transcriptional regulator FrlR [Pelotomaculum schinkii]TEB17893.1 DNA-binding transcriptional regulator FrlR [Pelotomaculum sp. FP]
MENGNTTSPLHTARYITIAMDIAERVLKGDYKEGQKISGRSTLSGLYNVSPETVRRALTLLQEADVVRVLPGAGVHVNSVEAARDYLAESGQYKVVKEMQERLARMVLERNQLNAKIEHLTTELLEYISSILSAKHKI